MRKLLLAFGLLLFGLTGAHAVNKFAVCAATCTWDASDTSMWSLSSGGATGAAVPTTADAVILDAATCVGGVTCTVTVNTTVAVQSITMGACTAATTGCILSFAANNNNVTLSSAASITGTGVRSLLCGSGTWTLSATGALSVWDLTTTTNLSPFTCNGGTIAITGVTASNRNFIGGAQTYGTLSVAANASRGSVTLSGANTFGVLSIQAGQRLILPTGVTTTVTAAFTWTGTGALPISLVSSSTTANATLAVAAGTSTVDWSSLYRITASGGTFNATNSLDSGLNVSVTITPPTSGGGGIIGG